MLLKRYNDKYKREQAGKVNFSGEISSRAFNNGRKQVRKSVWRGMEPFQHAGRPGRAGLVHFQGLLNLKKRMVWAVLAGTVLFFLPIH
jgi:hypothetical protein